MLQARGIISSVLIAIAMACSCVHGVVIEGSVVNEKGKGVPRASVSLIVSIRTTISSRKIAARGVTSDDGLFKIETTNPPTELSPMQLMIEAAGYAVGQVRLPIPGKRDADKPIKLAPISLSSPIRLRAQFLDSNGKPIEGLEVFLNHLLDGRDLLGTSDWWSLEIPPEARERFSRKTDAGGF